MYKAIFDKYGYSLSGFCRMVIELARADLSDLERANLLTAMGAIARYCEPRLQMEDGGKAYFDAAQRVFPAHLYSAMELLSLYLEQPDGHVNHELAVACATLIREKQYGLSEQDRELVRGVETALASRGVVMEELR